MKKLFLASEAKHPESMKKLEAFVGGLKGKSIAYIPTAANGEEEYGRWKTGETWNMFNNIGADIETVLLEDYKGPEALDHLKGKDIIFVAGGACGYLMYWIRRCKIDLHLEEILEKGTVYAGSSSGAMICAKSLDIAEAYFPEIEIGANIFPGLGLIDFDIFPHYEDRMLHEIRETWRGGDLYLLKNGEVITVVDGKIEVLGEKRILKIGDHD